MAILKVKQTESILTSQINYAEIATIISRVVFPLC